MHKSSARVFFREFGGSLRHAVASLKRCVFRIRNYIIYRSENYWGEIWVSIWFWEYVTDVTSSQDENECLNRSGIPQNLNEMINNPDFLQSNDTLVTVKKGELFFMILKYCVSNKSWNLATTNLFKLFNVVFESPVMPDSRYAVDKLLNPKTGVEFHAVCHNCSTYIGKHGEIESITHCQI